MLGYPSCQTFFQWINQVEVSNTRWAGGSCSPYDPFLKDEALKFVGFGLGAREVPGLLGISSAVVVYNWTRLAGCSPESEEHGLVSSMSKKG